MLEDFFNFMGTMLCGLAGLAGVAVICAECTSDPYEHHDPYSGITPDDVALGVYYEMESVLPPTVTNE